MFIANFEGRSFPKGFPIRLTPLNSSVIVKSIHYPRRVKYSVVHICETVGREKINVQESKSGGNVTVINSWERKLTLKARTIFLGKFIMLSLRARSF